MQVKFQGFELTLDHGPISWNDYLNTLSGILTIEVKFGAWNRILCLDSISNQNYMLGLFVSIKDQRRFCEISKRDGRFKLSSRTLENGTRIADFNFFIIMKNYKGNIHKGLYQYYYQSCSAAQFLDFLSQQFRSLKQTSIEELQPLVKTNPTAKGKIKAIKKMNLRSAILVKKETFDQLLDEMDHIDNASLDISTYEGDFSIIRPYRDAKRKIISVFFDRKRDKVEQIRHDIRRSLAEVGIGGAKVKGSSSLTGFEYTISTLKNVEDFGRYSYNDLTEHFTVDLKDFARSHILELLVTAAGHNNHILE